MTTTLIAPHGGTLINRVLVGTEREKAWERAHSLPQIALSAATLADLEMIATGGLSPLTGFMNREDYDSVVHKMRLANGLPWTIPVTLPVDYDIADTLQIGQEVALTEENGSGTRILAILQINDKFAPDKTVEAEQVYQTDEVEHPGVARLYKQGDVYLGGDVQVINLPQHTETEFKELRLTPQETRQLFAERGWKRIVAFQTRNPIHRAHEYLQKAALEIVDGLLLHPLVGQTKSDDIPADIRIESYRVILNNYYPKNRVLLSVFPAAMRYAGPREAIFHAIARKNYGCTHFIVGRDHAGVGKYYGTYDAQNIFDEFTPEEIGITPLRFEHAFYCRSCGQVATAKTCPHDKDQWVFLSGTQVREKLQAGEQLPPEFTRPEVSEILLRSMQQPSYE